MAVALADGRAAAFKIDDGAARARPAVMVALLRDLGVASEPGVLTGRRSTRSRMSRCLAAGRWSAGPGHAPGLTPRVSVAASRYWPDDAGACSAFAIASTIRLHWSCESV